MARVVFRLIVTGQNPGHNVCTVSMTSGGAEKILVSEGRNRTVPQAEVDGFLLALGSLKEPCEVEVITRSQCLVRRIAKMDTAPHAVTGTYVPRSRADG